MVDLPSSPTNLNLLYSNKFKFVINRMPHVTFFCHEANLPGLSIQMISIPTYVGSLKFPGGKVQFNELTVGFKVDEDLANWREVYSWLAGLGKPESLTQFKDLSDAGKLISDTPGYNVTSDATLISLTNSLNMNLSVTFRDIFPVSLNDLEFGSGTNQTLTAKASFAYTLYQFDSDLSPKPLK